MPFRVWLHTIVAVSLMLLAIGLWAKAVANMYFKVAVPATAQLSPSAAHAAVSLRQLFRGTLILSFILVLLVLVVGFTATWRERLRHKAETANRKRVPYVDAWKLAGERLETPENLEEE
ncbi:MAG: hypothetical protein WCI73_09810 [Phycisphaerae bacterium]